MADEVKQYSKWMVDMLQSFCDMRDAQNDYFAQKSEYRLKVAKAKEKIADDWIKRAVAAGIIKHKPNSDIKQNELF